MKKIAYIFALVALGWGTSAQTYDTDIVVVHDLTDSLPQVPDMETVQTAYNLKKDKWQGVRLTYTCISDRRLNDVEIVALPRGNAWWDYEDERNMKVKAFHARASALAKKAENQAYGRSYSEVYRVVATQLNTLSASSAEKRFVVIYGDLAENGDDLSFITAAGKKQLIEKPGEVICKLQSKVPLRSLKGITVYLVYAPATREADQLYYHTSQLYKKMLENAGAKVYIQSNLTLNP